MRALAAATLLLAMAAPCASADGVRLEVEDPPFTLDLTQPYRREPTLPGLLCHLKEATPAGTVPISLSIERLGGLLPRTPISRDEAVAAIARVAPGARVAVERSSWRGHEVDVIETRIGEPPAAGAMVMLSARLPLAGEALQLNVGGPAAREPAVRAALADALAGLQADARFAEDEERRRRFTIAGAIGAVAVFAAFVIYVRARNEPAPS